MSPTIEEAWGTVSDELQACRELQASVGGGLIPEAGLHLVYESILLRAFRTVELGLEQAFVAYMLGNDSLSGNKVESCLQARDRSHVNIVLLGSGNKWVEWVDAKMIRERSLVFFGPDNLIELSLAGSSQQMGWMRSLRNHVAHNSTESTNKYRQALDSMLTVAPSDLPTVGEFLASRPTKGALKNRDPLAYFLNASEKLMKDVTEYTSDGE